MSKGESGAKPLRSGGVGNKATHKTMPASPRGQVRATVASNPTKGCSAVPLRSGGKGNK